ncbi:hypothetical protein FRB91_001387 [Serendipita sp. 411]|nr:hypothetical protein FRC15_010862 [Serendipita sp. 397]KAG8802267.1 hypothetical protein FRC16_010082 [Serendipita sp. 398]KAG8830299.1 hypothetical protein FRC18_008304 [Serendipita sp. 400]KAG8845854.1 hypothetical protein FRB91_001387 [Serendipita sp. 411]KAG8870747.1 hypothetical protein FRC20_011385 [Serendipita sp. 405]KAG9057999.1 hypothetical protein FS842_002335 [Serendipita sp. 407]
MVFTILSNAALLWVFLAPVCVNASWRMNAHTMITARVDPLISPQAVSGHVHDYAGGNNFGVTYDYDNMRQSACTSVEINIDKSGYWSPAVYYKRRDGTFQLLKSSYTVYYLHRGSNQQAFPAGFRMIAGSAVKNTLDPNGAADQAINFHCLGPNTETLQFPDQACQDVRVQIMFPSCWNGKDLTSANFRDHVAYPVDGKEGNTCPGTHPVRFMTLFFEHIIYMKDIDWYPGSLVLADGDNVGWSSHADFINGWDVGQLQQAIDQCTDPYANLQACGYLMQFQNDRSASGCQPAKYLPLEDVGFYGPLQKLQGDNPVWGGGTSKATTGSSNTPPLVAPFSVVSSGWTEHGCIDEGDPYVNTMNGDKLVDQSMNPQMCVSYCDGKGFSLAGIENGDTCFCANQLDHNGSMNVVDFGKCLVKCVGSYYEWCGGGRNLHLWQKTGGNSAAASNYSYPPAGARLSKVYTADGSSVPVVSPPNNGSGSISSGSGSTSTGSSSSSGEEYGPNNPPRCPPRSVLKRRSKTSQAKRALHFRRTRGHHH